MATAMPVAARDLDGLKYYAWAFSAFLIGMLFATVLSGRLSDRIGPAKPLLVGLVIFLAGLVIAGSAPYMAQLVAGRLVQGLGSGAMNVAIYVCVAVAFSRRQRPKMFTYISTAWVLPSFVGPPVSAWLTQHLSWHWVFFAVIPLVIFGGAMAFPSLLRMMRAHRPTDADDDQTCANVGCRTTGRRCRDAAACRPAAGLVGGGPSGWRCGGSSGGAATADATRILEVSARTPSGRADPRASRRRILRR